MKRRHMYDDDYDLDNIAYRNNDDDDYDDDDEDNDETKDYSDELEDEDREPRDDENDDWESNFSGSNMMDLPAATTFNPANYDFTKIMEDYHSGNEARQAKAVEQAVYAMDALVKYVINRHYPTYREKHYEDMLQEGRMAVISTLGDYTGKCAPSSYFYTNIRHQIQVYIAEDVHRTTRHYAAMANKIRKAEIALAQIDGKDRHDDLTISVYTGLPLTTVIETRRQTVAADFVELNPNIDPELDCRDDSDNPAVAYMETVRIESIRNAVERLSELETQIIKMMYGFDDEGPINAPEIARRLHIKTDRVRKIAQDACRKLSHDKRLIRDLGVQDHLTSQKERASEEMPFMSMNFGGGQNFFDEISEEEDETASEATSLDDLFKPMNFTN